VFIGASPFYGAHLLLCWLIGRLLHLNRLKMYLAANISNPFVAPWLIFSELQTGAWVRRGELHAFTLDAVRGTNPWVFGLDLLAGSVVVGGILALPAAGATYAAARRRKTGDAFAALVARAADRYVSTSITAWEFARAKLQRDPVYRAVLCGGWLTSGDTLVDIGCGQGLMLALLAEGAARAGSWNDAPAPRFRRLIGVETRTRVARLARIALESDAIVVNADARTLDLEPCDTLLLFDVLHMMTPHDQDVFLARVATGLRPGGTILIREADAGSGWRFTFVAIGNRLKALALGRWRQRFHFRTAAAWTECFAQHGFATTVRDMGAGTPFGNVLFSLSAVDNRAAHDLSA
jgi:SAM-dependent methyltransferase